ncbi:hypothetical protein RJ55_02261 [Drechmeria coniospora]|nr:hypothetical protein RJ55_02261 [Drechmeria coniospora]
MRVAGATPARRRRALSSGLVRLLPPDVMPWPRAITVPCHAILSIQPPSVASVRRPSSPSPIHRSSTHLRIMDEFPAAQTQQHVRLGPKGATSIGSSMKNNGRGSILLHEYSVPPLRTVVTAVFLP